MELGCFIRFAPSLPGAFHLDHVGRRMIVSGDKDTGLWEDLRIVIALRLLQG